MGYELFEGEDREYEVAPATAARLEKVHRLQMKSRIVGEKTKRDICKRRGWDFEEEAEEEVAYDEHQRRLAQIVFMGVPGDPDWPNLLVGSVQEGLMDFLSHAGGVSNEGGSISRLLRALQNGVSSTAQTAKSPTGAATQRP